MLPIPTKNLLIRSRITDIVNKWYKESTVVIADTNQINDVEDGTNLSDTDVKLKDEVEEREISESRDAMSESDSDNEVLARYVNKNVDTKTSILDTATDLSNSISCEDLHHTIAATGAEINSDLPEGQSTEEDSTGFVENSKIPLENDCKKVDINVEEEKSIATNDLQSKINCDETKKNSIDDITPMSEELCQIVCEETTSVKKKRKKLIAAPRVSRRLAAKLDPENSTPEHYDPEVPKPSFEEVIRLRVEEAIRSVENEGKEDSDCNEETYDDKVQELNETNVETGETEKKASETSDVKIEESKVNVQPCVTRTNEDAACNLHQDPSIQDNEVDSKVVGKLTNSNQGSPEETNSLELKQEEDVSHLAEQLVMAKEKSKESKVKINILSLDLLDNWSNLKVYNLYLLSITKYYR